METLYVPRVAVGFAERVSVDVPLAVAGFGENCAVTLDGSPSTLSVTELLLPVLVNVTVKVLLDLRVTVIEEGAESEKLPAGGFTVTDRDVVCVSAPSVPLIVRR